LFLFGRTDWGSCWEVIMIQRGRSPNSKSQEAKFSNENNMVSSKAFCFKESMLTWFELNFNEHDKMESSVFAFLHSHKNVSLWEQLATYLILDWPQNIQALPYLSMPKVQINCPECWAWVTWLWQKFLSIYTLQLLMFGFERTQSNEKSLILYGKSNTF